MLLFQVLKAQDLANLNFKYHFIYISDYIYLYWWVFCQRVMFFDDALKVSLHI